MSFRLSEQELQIICQELLDFDPEGEIYLFGSRTDEQWRGGDIDLFFETQRAISLKQALLLQYRLTSACDTKVDLLVKQKDQQDEPIHLIAREGVRL